MLAWARRALRVGGLSAGACFSIATSVGFTGLALAEPDAGLVFNLPSAVTISPAFLSPIDGPREPALSVVSTPPGFTAIAAPQAFDRLPPRAPEVTPVESMALAASIVSGAPALEAGDRVQVTLSFYYCVPGTSGMPTGDGGGFCGAMRDGSVVYPGAAACDYAYLGQTFRIVGDASGTTYRCADTGSAVHGQHRDIWFNSSDEGWAWQGQVGDVATIEVLGN